MGDENDDDGGTPDDFAPVTSRLFVIAIVVIIVLIVLRTRCDTSREAFVSLDDKADKLAGWMREHGANATYTRFIEDNPDSNIVEYTRLRSLHVRKQLASRANVVEALRI